MSTTHHPINRTTGRPRPARCLKHRVWMASCADCGAEHRAILEAQKAATAG